MRPGERLAALEGLRGYAAMLVFLTHAFGYLIGRLYVVGDAEHLFVQDTADTALAAFAFLLHSNYGVDLFFVLSGLLMADVATRRWPGTPRFIGRRLMRIYPPYLASLVIVAIVVYFTMKRPVALPEGAANLALLQGLFPLGIHAINPVTWSLSYEAGFYLAVPAIAIAWGARRPGDPGYRLAFLAMLFVAIVAACAMLAADRAIYLAYFALFIPGIAIGMLDEEGRERVAKRVPTLFVLAAWAVFTLCVKTGVLLNTQPAYYPASALACGLLVLKACDSGSTLARLFALPAMRWLGRYSYSFFLIHYIVVHYWGGVAWALIGGGTRFTFAVVFLAGALAISLAAARVLYALTERWYFSARDARPGKP
jgi:peptidoglycan/LPS O-acetylase OafA/YrhL